MEVRSVTERALPAPRLTWDGVAAAWETARLAPITTPEGQRRRAHARALRDRMAQLDTWRAHPRHIAHLIARGGAR